MGSNPLISAVVTTFNRASFLEPVLLSLVAQTLPSDDYEIIVIDDGSTDEAPNIIQRLSSIFPSIQYVCQRNSGLASAKNHGLCCSQGNIVLFLDDDDLADCTLLEQHLIAHAEFPDLNYAILGHTSLSPKLESDPLMNFVTNEGSQLFSYSSIKPKTPLSYSHFWGGRTSCKRRYLLENGVFNPIFKFGFEDIELGYRLSNNGLAVFYWPLASSTMIRKIAYRDFLSRCYKQGQSACAFSRLYPRGNIAYSLNLGDAISEWEIISSAHSSIIDSAAKLDYYARSLVHDPFGVSSSSLSMLHLTYNRAFRAELLRGFVDATNDAESNVSTFDSRSAGL